MAPAFAPSPDAMIEDIQQIRRQLDADLYRGTMLDKVRPAHSLAGQEVPHEPEPPPSPESAFAAALREAAAKAANKTDRDDNLGLRRNLPVQSVADSAMVGALRRAARALDEKAAGLEDTGQYEEADQLRTLAGELWQTARCYDRTPPPAPDSP
jgi:hypothetical protein